MAKEPLRLDWKKLLPQMEQGPPPEVVVVAGRCGGDGAAAGWEAASQDEAEPRSLAERTDHQLKVQIQRLLKNLNSEMVTLLPDKGEKLRVKIRMLQDELDRRKLCPHRKDPGRCNKVVPERNTESSGSPTAQVIRQNEVSTELQPVLDDALSPEELTSNSCKTPLIGSPNSDEFSNHSMGKENCQGSDSSSSRICSVHDKNKEGSQVLSEINQSMMSNSLLETSHPRKMTWMEKTQLGEVHSIVKRLKELISISFDDDLVNEPLPKPLVDMINAKLDELSVLESQLKMCMSDFRSNVSEILNIRRQSSGDAKSMSERLPTTYVAPIIQGIKQVGEWHQRRRDLEQEYHGKLLIISEGLISSQSSLNANVITFASSMRVQEEHNCLRKRLEDVLNAQIPIPFP